MNEDERVRGVVRRWRALAKNGKLRPDVRRLIEQYLPGFVWSPPKLQVTVGMTLGLWQLIDKDVLKKGESPYHRWRCTRCGEEKLNSYTTVRLHNDHRICSVIGTTVGCHTVIAVKRVIGTRESPGKRLITVRCRCGAIREIDYYAGKKRRAHKCNSCRYPTKHALAVLDHEIVVAQYFDGKSPRQIAKEFGVTRDAVREVLDGRGITRLPGRGSGRKVHALDAGEVRRLYLDEGFSIEKLARHYSVSPKAMRKFMRGQGIEIRPKWGNNLRFSPEEVRMIRARLRQGEAQTSVAAHYGVNSCTISNIARGASYNFGEYRE